MNEQYDEPKQFEDRFVTHDQTGQAISAYGFPRY